MMYSTLFTVVWGLDMGSPIRRQVGFFAARVGSRQVHLGNGVYAVGASLAVPFDVSNGKILQRINIFILLINLFDLRNHRLCQRR